MNGTGNSTALQISHDGDYPVIDIDAAAARTGLIIDVNMTNQEAEQILATSGGNITGAANEGLIDIDLGTGALAANASALRIEGSGNHNAASNMVYLLYDTGTLGAANATGFMLRLEDTSGAQATSYAMYISSTNNEALHVDTGEVLVDEFVTASLGFVTEYDESIDLAATPTNANFDAAFGATELGKAGWMGIAKDSGGTPVYFVASDGTDWWYVALTKAL